jgi:hypothetical protein
MSNRTDTILRDLAGSIILAACLAYLSALWWQSDEKRVSGSRQVVATAQASVCEFGAISVIMPFCGGISDDLLVNLNERLASQASMRTAISNVHWNNISEAEAVRYTAFIRGLQSGTWSDQGSNNPWELARNALWPIWQAYPDIAVGSQSYWRYFHDSNMYEWFTKSRQHDEYLASLVETIPHLFGQFHTHVKPNQDEVLSLAKLQAPLGFHGNRYGFLGSVLIRHGDNSALHDLVANTNSAAPIMGQDWSTIAPQAIRLSWQQGVLSSDDLPKFTATLVAQGYRPALRWAVWMSAEGRRSKSLRRMAMHAPSYTQILNTHTEFNIDNTKAWDQFYSENWSNIVWNSDRKKWLIN